MNERCAIRYFTVSSISLAQQLVLNWCDHLLGDPQARNNIYLILR